MASKHHDPKHFDIKIQTDFIKSENEEKFPNTCAYAFSQGGQLITCEPFKPNDSVSLRIPVGKEASSIRLLIGPALPEQDTKLAELLRRGAVDQQLRVDRNLHLHLQIVPNNWLCWLSSLCLVKGTLLKRTTIDGIPIDLPVCNAHVDIYEVDPISVIIGNLTLAALEDLRGYLRMPPLPDSDFPVPPRQPLEPPIEDAQFAARQLTLNQDLDLFRDSLIRNVTQIKPFLWPILCRFYGVSISKQKVGHATTDDCGRFQSFFNRGCNNPDTPDLYFKATQQLFGFLNILIYDPKPVNCFTHWNYQCGSEVTLYTSSPWAKVCSPCTPIIAENHWVLVRAIGNLPLSRIRGCSTELSASTNNANIGLNMTLPDFNAATDDNPATNPIDRPFGGLLRLRIEFDNSIREALGVNYYQVSFRKGSSGDFLPLTGEIHRHYSHEIPHVPGDDGDHPETHLVEEGYLLGPQLVNDTPNLYEIPPALPPQGQWTIPDLTEDTINAKFPSNTFAPPAEHGKYQLKIDLFDAAGNKVDIDNIDGQSIHYVVPADADPSSGQALYTDEAEPLNLIQTIDAGFKSFVMTLHVDNNVCEADISLPNVNGINANDCGVINYNDLSANVNINYSALHPNGFADYSFTLVRGTTNLNTLTQSGAATGNFISSNLVSNLLSEDCPMAGFSAHLHVNARATDGFGEINAYDAGDHIGFALTLEE